MTADLAEEHSTATLAAERLEAEQADRLKLEKDNAELKVRTHWHQNNIETNNHLIMNQVRNKHLSSTNDRMEMELMYSRALDMNGGLGDSDDSNGGGADGSVLRQKYERAAKDLEMAKKRLAQQHEDDMEQLMALKKQLEKKVDRPRQDSNLQSSDP